MWHMWDHFLELLIKKIIYTLSWFKVLINFMLFGKMIFDAKGKILLRNPGKKTILQLNETSKYLFSLILRNRKHYGYASLSKLS